MINKVKVLGMTYSIIFDEELEEELGIASYADTTIKVSSDLNEQMVKSTLLHEIVHCISKQTGANLKEGQVNAIECGLSNFLRDNRELVLELMSDAPETATVDDSRIGFKT